MTKRLDFNRDKGRPGWTDDNEPPFVRLPTAKALCLAHRAGRQPLKSDRGCFLCRRLSVIRATHKQAIREERLALRKPRPL